MCNHVLHLSWMLRRAVDQHRAVILRNRNCNLTFQIEVILPSDDDCALKAPGRLL